VPERQLALKNIGKEGIASNQKGYGEFAVEREFSI
jgi:hypothetical protein